MFLLGLDNLEKYVNTCLVVCLGCMLTLQICIMTLWYMQCTIKNFVVMCQRKGELKMKTEHQSFCDLHLSCRCSAPALV